MPTFILSLNWTDQGIRSVKDAPKRAQAARELAKTLGVEIKEVYLTSGENDLLIFLDTPNGDNVAKFALALGARRATCALAPPELGLSPNSKSSYPSFHDRLDMNVTVWPLPVPKTASKKPRPAIRTGVKLSNWRRLSLFANAA
jgi:uncharacterized protein with GYD domain